jgi:hypothetical protein
MPRTVEQKRAWFKDYDTRRPPVYRIKKAASGSVAYQRLRANPELYAKRCEEAKIRQRAYWRSARDNPTKWLKLYLASAPHRAAKRGWEFSITSADITLAETCPVFGVTLKYGHGTRDPDGATLDRIDPEKGYVAGNVRVISWRANNLRRDCVDPKLFRLLADDADRLALHMENKI